MTPREFLQANIDVIEPNLIKQAAKDLNEMSTDAWYKKYKDQFINNKDTAIDFLKIKEGNSLPERLRKAFGDIGFNPKDVHKQAIYQTQFKDVPKGEFDRQLNRMKSLYDYEIKLQEDNRLRNERIKEVNKPDWKRTLFASDYENQRYIDDPKSAIFGKQAPGFVGSSAGAKADLISGVAAGAADVGTAFIPVPGINLVANALVGPTIRAGRDIAHKGDSPYQKDWSKLAKDVGSDVAMNLGIAGAANIGKISRIGSRFASPNVKNAIALKEDMEAIKKGLKTLPKASNTDEFVEAIDRLPDSPLKTELKTTVSQYVDKGVDVKKAEDIISAYGRDTDIDWINFYKKAGPGGIGKIITPEADDQILKAALTTPSTTPYLNRVLTTAPLNTAADKAQLKILNGLQRLNVGWPGTVVFEGSANAVGRGSSPKTVETDSRIANFKREKEAYKAQFGESWLKYGKAFAPKEKEGDPLWEAYLEVMEGK